MVITNRFSYYLRITNFFTSLLITAPSKPLVAFGRCFNDFEQLLELLWGEVLDGVGVHRWL